MCVIAMWEAIQIDEFTGLWQISDSLNYVLALV